ncbi:MAG: hypothetical protein ABIQ90_12950 [Polaromonas sp.]
MTKVHNVAAAPQRLESILRRRPEAGRHDGAVVYGGPDDMQLIVRICAHGVAPERLRAVVQDAVRRSPIPNAVQNATPLALRIDVDAA